MRRRKKQKLKFLLLISAIILASIGIAYAALSTTLTITMNKVTQNALTWNVAFNTGSVTGTASGTSDTGLSCGTATAAATAITVADTTLSKPGDKCTYAFTIKNTGGIAAKLGTLVPTKPSSITCTTQNASTSVGAQMVCGNLTYKITTDSAGSTPLKTGTTIAASTGTQAVYLIVSYTGTDINSSDVTQSGGKFTFTYNQA